jgi:hypothetical protein
MIQVIKSFFTSKIVLTPEEKARKEIQREWDRVRSTLPEGTHRQEIDAIFSRHL